MAERATARIDSGAITANCARLKQAASPGTALCAVVKADGYGHGESRVAAAALAGGADWLAVATPFEARRVGQAFPGVPLLTLGALREEGFELALAAGSEVSAWTAEGLEMAAGRARALGSPARIHLKLDSGMGRLGNRDREEIVRLAGRCDEDPDLELAGFWTHFATADEPGSDFFDEQLRRFSEVAMTLRDRHSGLTVHAANSAALLRDPEAHFDMARCGIAIYGMDPFGEDPAARDLRPAMTLMSYVADVKWFERGASAGYSQTWRAATGTWVAALPIGYGDGVRRAYSNNGSVLIGGRRYPIVGNVSMDNLTVDLGPETEVRPGDEAVLLGSQGDERITAEEIARRLETINYEVTTSITSRVVRVAV